METTVDRPVRVTKKQQAENERNEAKEKLRGWLKPGDTVFTILRHVSRSGMMRHISLVANVEGETMDITYWAAKAMDDKLADDGGIKVGGCGMDMGFSLVYNLGRTLYHDGFYCPGKGDGKGNGRCPSNDHFNGDKNYRKDHKHTGDGGYALRHRWL